MKKIIIKKGNIVGDYTSNGEHYFLINSDKWCLYTAYGVLLTQGKIKSNNDVEYITNLCV